MKNKNRANLKPYEDMKRIDENETYFVGIKQKEVRN